MAYSPDPSQHNYTSSEYQGDQQVQEYDSTQDAQRWYDDNVNEDAQQKAERLNRLRLQLERAAAREGTSTGNILDLAVGDVLDKCFKILRTGLLGATTTELVLSSIKRG